MRFNSLHIYEGMTKSRESFSLPETIVGTTENIGDGGKKVTLIFPYLRPEFEFRLCNKFSQPGVRGSLVVTALGYKPEGSGLETP
jgi:hypothetical protein